MQQHPNKRRIILIEYNELCTPLLREWMSAGALPNFKAFYDASTVFETRADAIDDATLNPWVQWYSLHTGLPYSTHGVYQLTDGPKKGHPDIWSELLKMGKSVANFSSMNAKAFSAPGSIFLPDPWCETQDPSPMALMGYYGFIARQVREYTNTSRSLEFGIAIRFATFLLRHGLRLQTVLRIIAQVASESGDKKEKWRRPVLLDQIQFDIFRHYWERNRFDFCTFFSNSTAHFQHCYWRHMQPELFAAKPSDDDLRRYGQSIRFGYECMDRQLGEFLKLDDGATLFVLATALSQEPQLKHENVGGWHFYRPFDVDRLLQDLGIQPSRLQSIMAQQYILDFQSADDAEKAAIRLGEITCNGRKLFDVIRKGPLTIGFGSQIKDIIPDDAVLAVACDQVNWTKRFYDVFYLIDGTKSGGHNPSGLLWFRTGRHRLVSEAVDLTDVFPTVMEELGLVSADSTRPGKSLSNYLKDPADGERVAA